MIVTDDGSNSTAEGMLRERYPWARWIAGPRRGPAANRNNGARAARGEWLAFTDDDCLPEPGWLAAYHAASLAGAEILEGKTICSQGIRSCLDEAPVNLRGGGFPSCNLMMRRDTFHRLGRFDEDFGFWCEDQYFHLTAQRAGCFPKFVGDAVVDHPRRRRPSGWNMGLRWEARILLWHKEGRPGSVWRFFPIHCLKVRIAQALEYPLQPDTLLAVPALAAEMLCLLTHLGRWDRKYRRFRPTSQASVNKAAQLGAA